MMNMNLGFKIFLYGSCYLIGSKLFEVIFFFKTL